MNSNAPAQLFDGSVYEALAATPELKTPPKGETVAQSLSLEAASTPEEFENFDWDAYNRDIAKRLKLDDENDEERRQIRDNLGTQLWICTRLPAPVTQFLLTSLPPKELWEHLNHERLRELRHGALRGFQQTPASLRREPVIKRMVAWLERHPNEVHLLLLRWATRAPQPEVVAALQAQPDEATLKGRLPSIVRTFGPSAAAAAVAFAGQPRVFKHLTDLVNDEEAFSELLKNAPLYGAEAPAEPAPPAAPPADSPAAHFWRERAELAATALENLEAQTREMQAKIARLESADARILTLQSEIAMGKKRDKHSAATAAKKLAQLEKKWADKYLELEKNYARQERRLRASEGGCEEFKAENKRQKKQLRQSAQSREEERKKVVALETKLAQLAPVAPANGRPAMDAVSSPPTTQDKPNAPVKVARPSPLDEIFEWRADGRRVRVTAREVRRLIDKNDEDRVADIMLALEALQGSNPDLRKRFLARLGEAGAHYPRVLTHRTTRVLVDASNVARFCPNKYGKGRLRHLLLMRAELQRLDCWPIVLVADASLPHFIDEPQELREMARAGEIQITDKGIEADEILAREARKTGAYVVTNDAKFFHKVSPDFEPPRISFRVHDDLVVVDEF